jgi:hypothetical protein
MRVMPSIPMFWVISTAQVLQGVIISQRGPINGVWMVVASSGAAFPKSQVSFSTVSAEKAASDCTAITLREGVRKNEIITFFFD